MKIPSTLQINLLEALGSRELTGVEIGEAYQKTHKTHLPIGSIYTSLNRLESVGWIASEKRRGVRLYKVSTAGAKNMKHLKALKA